MGDGDGMIHIGVRFRFLMFFSWFERVKWRMVQRVFPSTPCFSMFHSTLYLQNKKKCSITCMDIPQLMKQFRTWDLLSLILHHTNNNNINSSMSPHVIVTRSEYSISLSCEI